MTSKGVETIDHLPQEGKKIVQPFGKPEKELHHRHGYWFRNPPELAARNRGSRHPYRRCHVHRARWSLVSIRQTLSREVLGAVQGFWCLPLVMRWYLGGANGS
jgi:hypothetical protein